MNRLPANSSRFTFEIMGVSQPFKVLSFRGESELSALYHYDIICLCEDPSLAIETYLFKSALLTLVSPLGNRLVHGMIHCCEQLDARDLQSRYRFQIVPAIWLLTQRTGHRIFQHQSVKDIVQLLLGESGIDKRYVCFELHNRYQKKEYVVQYAESEYQFICRLLEQEGIHFHFIHTPENHQWVLADSNSVFANLSLHKPIRYHQEQRLAKDETIISALVSQQTSGCNAASVSDYNFTKPNLKIAAKAQKTTGHERGLLETYHYRNELMVDNKDADRYRNIHEQQLRCELNFIEICTDDTRLYAGCKFSVTDHPNPSINAGYLLVRESIAGELPQSQLEYSGSAAASFKCSAKAIPENVSYRSAKVTDKPKIRGVQTAFVTGPGNNEIYTDRYGRIKIQFHWDREGRRNENSSCWVRVSHRLAGKAWGAQSIPRVGQEVIVSFEEGNPDRPIVVGALYNHVNRPPYPLPQQKACIGIITRSAEKGNGFHELRIDNCKGSEKVFVRSEKDFDIRVNNDRKIQVDNDYHLSVASDSFTAIQKDLHSTVRGADHLAVGNDFSLSVGGDLYLKVSGAKVTEVGKQLHIKGGLKTTLQAGAQLSLVVGGSFVTLDSSGVSISGPMVRINEGGSAVSALDASPIAAQPPQLPDDDNSGHRETLPSLRMPGNRPLDLRAGTAQAVTFKAAARERIALVDSCSESQFNSSK